MIVTIARELGAGGLSVGEALAQRLDATLLDERTLIDRLATRGGFSAEYLSRVDERPPTFASSFVADLARATALVQAMEWRSTEHAVLDEIRAVVLEAATASPVVLIGHGGPKLLTGVIDRSQIFSILLHAGRDWRIEQIVQRFGCTRTEAADRISRTDELRKRYVAHFFATDLYDARTYDLVIDSERTGLETAKAIVLAAVSSLSTVS